MKVRELIEQLQKFDGDLEVHQSSDSEGNSFAPVDEANKSYAYIHQYEVNIAHIDEKDKETYPEEYEAAKKVVILWPAW